MKLTIHLPESLVVNTTTTQYESYKPAPLKEVTSTRSDKKTLALDVEDDDIAELHFEDGTIWMGPAWELPEILSDPSIELKRGIKRDPSVFYMPDSLIFEGESRGIGKKIKAFAANFFRKEAKAAVTEFLVKNAAKKFDQHQQKDPGLYKVLPDFSLRKNGVDINHSEKPILLFLHGTASDFEGSFGKIKAEDGNNELYKHVSLQYVDRMYAFEHYTLSESPVRNALDLLKVLPDNIRLHIISHSRGGMIGEILSLYHSGNKEIGFSDQHIKQLSKIPEYKEDLEKIQELMKTKKIHIERFVRVACPIMGTSLCSERLDRFFNILLNGLKLIAPPTGPTVDIIKEIIASILATKTETDVVPGLEAMSPTSKLVGVLNDSTRSIEAPLSVIRGNAKIELQLRSIITIISKGIFYGPNDWIVDTKSMLGGYKRTVTSGAYIHEDGDVNHFRYFLNDETRKAIKDALEARVGELAPAFTALEATRLTATRGVIMGSYFTENITGRRPVVIIVPGILGSNISRDGEEIYLNFGKLGTGGMSRLSFHAPNITADSIIGDAYRTLGNFLETKYDIVTYPYDWRKSMTSEAEKFAAKLTSIMAQAGEHPVKIIAHSMGGVLTRQVYIKHPDVWKELSERNGFKTIFLGTPFGGSYLIPEVLVGEGKRIKQMARLDVTNDREELLRLFSEYQGLLNLLPTEADPDDFSSKDLWKRMHDQSKDVNWTIPDLKEFIEFRNSVRDMDTSIWKNENVIYVAGKAESTTNKIEFSEQRPNGHQLKFESTPDGDGSVTWKSGIPSPFYNTNRLYYVPVNHGALANDSSLFDGIEDLLKSGTTYRFSRTPVELPKGFFKRLFSRGVEPVLNDHELALSLLDCEPQTFITDQFYDNIQIDLVCGDLQYAKYPVMIGHLATDDIWGAEAVMDRYLGGLLREQLQLGLYPDDIGTSEVFETKEKTAVIVGLGMASTINANAIEFSIKQAVKKYLLRAHRNRDVKPSKNGKSGITMLLMGTNYIGLSVETILKTIITASNKANSELSASGFSGKLLKEIQIIEVYEDKAVQCFHILSNLKNQGSIHFDFTQNKLHYVDGKKKRILSEKSDEWWMRLIITKDDTGSQNEFVHDLKYTASENLARAEVIKHSISYDTLKSLLMRMSNDDKWNKDMAMTLFTKLIPPVLKDTYNAQQNVAMLIDLFSAQFPWELMQDVEIQSDPLVTKTGFVRQLATENYRIKVPYTNNLEVLVIADPQLDNWDKFGQLEGARIEGEHVTEVFKQRDYQVTSLICSKDHDITININSKRRKIIHIAAHGHYDENNRYQSGLVIGKNLYLRTNDIAGMHYVPEFVFVNACYLGRIDSERELAAESKHILAANIGVELIKSGVKAVVVAGWAVNDAAALEFAKVFYEEMFAGKSFAEALLTARQIVYKNYPRTNTWGAYQAYGNPQYRFDHHKTSSGYVKNDYLLIPQIRVELENLVGSKYSNNASEWMGKKLHLMEQQLTIQGCEDSGIWELLAAAYNNLRMSADALRIYEEMMKYQVSRYSMEAVEKYYTAKRKVISTGEASMEKIEQLKKLLEEIDALNIIYKTSERMALGGGTWKDIFKMKHKLSKSQQKKVSITQGELDAALQSCSEYYEGAFTISTTATVHRFYTLIQTETIKLSMHEKIIERKIKGSNKYTKQAQEIKTRIESEYRSISDRADNPKEYWEKMLPSNLMLFNLLFDPVPTNTKNLIDSIFNVWKSDGTINLKTMEIENLDFLIAIFDKHPAVVQELQTVRSTLNSYLNQ